MLRYLDTVPSTNDYLLHRLPQVVHGQGVFTDRQTQGRGRRGRQWNDKEGENLALSVAFLRQPVEEIGLFPLFAGVAAVRTLKALDFPVSLKWSNDILASDVAEKKLGGILCESKISSEGADVVIGIGINLCRTEEELFAQGLSQATSLTELGGALPSLPVLATALWQTLCQVFTPLWPREKAQLLAEYRRYCTTLGQPVTVLTSEEIFQGTALDVAENGELLCNIEGKLRSFSSGEVSLRPWKQ